MATTPRSAPAGLAAYLPRGRWLLVAGAFLLGWLLEALSRGGPDEGRRRAIRLFVGTGIMGGYTTYSSFAVDTDGLIATAHLGDSIL